MSGTSLRLPLREICARDISDLGFQPRRTDCRVPGLMDKVYDIGIIEEADAKHMSDKLFTRA